MISLDDEWMGYWGWMDGIKLRGELMNGSMDEWMGKDGFGPRCGGALGFCCLRVSVFSSVP